MVADDGLGGTILLAGGLSSQIFHQLTAVSELPTVGFLRACQRRSRVVIDLLRESPSLEPEQALGLQHLVENAERVASDNFGYISFGQTLGS